MKKAISILTIIPLLLLFCGCEKVDLTFLFSDNDQAVSSIAEFDMKYVPEYHGTPYCEINSSIPFFTDDEMTVKSYEYYSPLDSLGRCGECTACIGKDLMPTEKRESIGTVKPSGWQLVRYEGIINGNYLYNRCHLIGFQLSGENANERNLITGTRYLNEDGMLPFENMTASYVRTTGNHVMYRVTPVFEGNDLVAEGVLMEAKSVEDNGAGLQFNVFCYNVQPQICIDYSTGESHLEGNESVTAIIKTTTKNKTTTKATTAKNSKTTTVTSKKKKAANSKYDYIVNTSSKKFHKPDCPSAADIKEENRMKFKGSRDELIKEGYTPCKQCDP